MRAVRIALWPAAAGFGIGAELAGRPALPVLDALTGFSLLGLGLFAWHRQPRYAVGWILAAASGGWFLGTIASWAVFLHRGPFAQLLITYPARRLWASTAVERAAIVAAYGYAITVSVATSEIATISFAVLVLAVAAWRCLVARGPQRVARTSALAIAVAFAVVLLIVAVVRLAGGPGGRGLLIVYELVMVLGAGALTADLVWGNWSRGLLASLVVDLGEPAAAVSLRDRLARVLGDPGLAVGFWVPEQASYVDEAGRQLHVPDVNSRRGVRLLEDDNGLPLAVLIHDPAILDDRELLEDVAAATRLAVTNARLQAEIRARVQEVEVSRRRLVEAAGEQRRGLEHQLRTRVERRLTQLAKVISEAGPELVPVNAALDAARRQLRELSRGIHPATLTNNGLGAALSELAESSVVPVEIIASAERWPPATEAVAYFLCAEALTNTAKYADASQVRIRITAGATGLEVEVRDDGVGGADPTRGSGLRGLADRVAALAGQLAIKSEPGNGTTLTAWLPLAGPAGDERVGNLPKVGSTPRADLNDGPE